MLPISPPLDDWLLLTPQNIRNKHLWGWGSSLQKFISMGEPRPRDSQRLLISSDYGGNHPRSTHLIYSYLIIRQHDAKWLSNIQSIRKSFLSDGRTMSYKRLDDPQRQAALIPFLAAAADLDGHLVSIAVDKRIKFLSTQLNSIDIIKKILEVKAPWNHKSLDDMLRKVHFVAIFLSIWSRPYTNVTWITDEDEFVANGERHDDALLAAGKMSSFYCPHPMGTFRLNTTGQDLSATDFEDVCAIPDLAAGMLSEISTRLTKEARWVGKLQRVVNSILPAKTDIIANWFWDEDMRLRKSLITFELDGPRVAIQKVWMQHSN